MNTNPNSPATSLRILAPGATVSRDPAVQPKTGFISPPQSGVFDETVEVGESVVQAVRRCRAGGTILLRPGTHLLPKDDSLLLATPVHIFGNGRASLECDSYTVVSSSAPSGTLDGVKVHCRSGKLYNGFGILITAGAIRVQRCEVTSDANASLCVMGSAAPFIVACKFSGGSNAGCIFRDTSFPGGTGAVSECEFFDNVGPGIVIMHQTGVVVSKSKIRDGRGPGVLIFECWAEHQHP